MGPATAIAAALLAAGVTAVGGASAGEGREVKHEPMLRKYFGGYESKDWSAVESCLAEGFTFSSAYDDPIDKRVYKERCWANAGKIGSCSIR